jgi:hypothetical protein
LWRSADRDFSTAELVGTFDASGYADSGGLLAEGSWYFKVRAVNACGWSAD